MLSMVMPVVSAGSDSCECVQGSSGGLAMTRHAAYDVLAPPFSTETFLEDNEDCLPCRQGSLPFPTSRGALSPAVDKKARCRSRFEASALSSQVCLELQ
jgi:hypothetical protein